MKFLIDTNVISELRKPAGRRSPGVASWFDAASPQDLFLSVLVVGEIRKGIESRRSSDPAQAAALDMWLNGLEVAYSDRILPVTQPIAHAWGRAQIVRPFPVIDGLLAATAQVHGLRLVTRNEADLLAWPTPNLVFNPFS